MSTEIDDTVSFLAKLEARRDALNQAIDSLRAYISLEGGAAVAGIGGVPREITSTTFWGKTIPEATKIYLAMVNKRPQTTQQVADALIRGGMETNAKDFPGTVQAMLRRFENQTGEIIRVPSGEWALPEWFPDRPRKKKGGKDKAASAAGSPEDDVAPEIDTKQANGAA